MWTSTLLQNLSKQALVLCMERRISLFQLVFQKLNLTNLSKIFIPSTSMTRETLHLHRMLCENFEKFLQTRRLPRRSSRHHGNQELHRCNMPSNNIQSDVGNAYFQICPKKWQQGEPIISGMQVRVVRVRIVSRHSPWWWQRRLVHGSWNDRTRSRAT